MAKIRFVGENFNKVVEIGIGERILEGALAKGIDIPHGCTYGSCYSCQVDVVKGGENIEIPGSGVDDKPPKTILTCLSKIKNNGDIVLKI